MGPMGRWRGYGALLTSALVAGCAAGEPDQLVVTVVDGTGGRLSVPGDLDAFELRVSTVRASDAVVRYRRVVVLRREASRGDGVPLPQSLTIVRAQAGSSGTVRVEVLGLRHGAVLQRISRTATFGIGRRELPPFALTPLCFGVTCPPGQLCQASGECAPDATCPPIGGCDAGFSEDAGACGRGQLLCGAGCVTSDENNCGSCGDVCAPGRRCLSGRCTCAEGLVECAGACVDLASDAAHCGACGAACSLPNATAACASSACVVTGCGAGFADCDGVAANGCETALDTPSDCGSCGAACALAHATAACSGGSCVVGRCASGWGDCDGVVTNGCENSLDSLSDCGACGRGCSLPHSSESCGSGSCRIGSCDGGWDDCNGNASDGCETDLSGDESNCGSCGNRCPQFERCGGGSCSCAGFPNYGLHGTTCLPSCGGLAGMHGVGIPLCCPSGCIGPAIVGMWASYDCAYCCDNTSVVPSRCGP